MKLDEAKEACRTGTDVRADYFGKGWLMTFEDGEFWDRNPVTGAMLMHIFRDRDETAIWAPA